MPDLKNAKLNQARRQQNSKKLPVASAVETTEDSTDLADDTKAPALVFLNRLQTTEALLPLPHIGEGRARSILKNKGEGYIDLTDLKARSGVSLTDAQWQEIGALLDFELPIQE
jgi:hypothetical protein